MKKFTILCLSVFILISASPFCFADDTEENHVCFKRVDSNHDETVTFQEFEKFYGKDTEKFQEMDQDNNKKITHDEYEAYLYNEEE